MRMLTSNQLNMAQVDSTEMILNKNFMIKLKQLPQQSVQMKICLGWTWRDSLMKDTTLGQA